MFHGCRTASNESSIISHGFQVSHCRSGGNDFGTWFAYGAAYSNSGYVFAQHSGERHIFVCMVSDRHVKLDNCTMRVVEQGCAYPLWLLTYKLPTPPPAPVPPVVPSALPVLQRKRQKQSAPQKFFVVRNGSWVAER
eukprot:UN2529